MVGFSLSGKAVHVQGEGDAAINSTKHKDEDEGGLDARYTFLVCDAACAPSLARPCQAQTRVYVCSNAARDKAIDADMCHQ